MFAVVALIKIDVDACPRQCDQLDGRGSGDKKNDGGNVLNPRSEDPHKTVSVCGRDVEARVGVLLFFFVCTACSSNCFVNRGASDAMRRDRQDFVRIRKVKFHSATMVSVL